MNEQWIADHVDAGWGPGSSGKGLLWLDGDRRATLSTWRTLAFGGPHHSDVQAALEIDHERVVAWIEVDAAGTFEELSRAANVEETVVDIIARLDARLRPPDAGWVFR